MLLRNVDDNKDNSSILLATFNLSPFSSWKTISGVTCPLPILIYNAPLSRRSTLMHRDITKRISELNTDGIIMREIKVVSMLHRSEIQRNFNWFCSRCTINSTRAFLLINIMSPNLTV